MKSKFSKSKNLKRFKRVLVFILAIMAITSCGNHNGFKYIDKNLYVKCITKNKQNSLIKIGDYIRVSMQYATLNDSVFFDTKKELAPIWIPVIDPSYEGDIMKGLAKMHLGDSCIFKVRTDSFYLKTMGYRKMPPNAPRDSFIFVRIKVEEIKNKEAFEAERRIIEEQLQKQYEELAQKEVEDLKAFLKANHIEDKSLASGLYYIPRKPGKGPKPVPGQKVLVSYKATFIDGQLFDQIDPYHPLQITVGSSDVIEGFNIALLSMREGETATWIIPSSKAYGKSSMDSPVPPYATLVFTITLHKILP
jgi:FKBP-type peptidyl-prolyl cis-trans isomerase